MATFGETGEGTGTVGLQDRIVGGIFNCPEIGTGVSISAYIDDSSSAMKLKAALYLASDLTAPITNGQTEEIAGALGVQWFTFNFSTGPNLVNDDYAILVWSDSTANLMYETTGAGRYDNESYGAWPSLSFTTLDRVFSIYCTYTAEAAAAVKKKVMGHRVKLPVRVRERHFRHQYY